MPTSLWQKEPVVGLEHSPYIPDLAADDFWFFSELKFVLKGQRFQDIEGVHTNVIEAKGFFKKK